MNPGRETPNNFFFGLLMCSSGFFFDPLEDRSYVVR
jgi:hypothetical protein